MFSHQIGRRRDRITLNGTEFSDGTGQRERLASFKTNPAGAAIVTTIAELHHNDSRIPMRRAGAISSSWKTTTVSSAKSFRFKDWTA